MLVPAVHFHCQRLAFSQPQCSLERFRDALLGVGADLEPVHYHIDIVFGGFGQFGDCIQFMDFAIDTDADEALCFQFLEQIDLFALAVADDRCEDHQLCFFR